MIYHNKKFQGPPHTQQENRIHSFSQNEKNIKQIKAKPNIENFGNSSEMNINYINLNYVQEVNNESKTANNNLAYMKNISKLMKKIEQNKSKPINQLPTKYYKKDTHNKPPENKEKDFLEDFTKNEIKSYQYVLNIEEKKLDPEDIVPLKKKRNSSIPGHFHLMQKQKKSKISIKENERKIGSQKFI